MGFSLLPLAYAVSMAVPGIPKANRAQIVNATFKKLRPVPPKTSLATTTPKEIPSATCHSGIVGGSLLVLLAGVALMSYTYFVDSALAMVAVGCALMALPYFLKL